VRESGRGCASFAPRGLRCRAEADGAGAKLWFSGLADCADCRIDVVVEDLSRGSSLECDDPGFSLAVYDDDWGSVSYGTIAPDADPNCALATFDWDPTDEQTPWEGSISADLEVMEPVLWMGFAPTGPEAWLSLESIVPE
jgi:hypothetical protein